MKHIAISQPVLVFGGPYSNLQATERLVEEADRLRIPPERIICTGDVVAYCGHPEETTAAIRAWGIHVVQGNCEEQLASGAGDCGCGFDEGSACDRLAKSWYDFADRRLSSESRRWMGRLPRVLDLEIGGVSTRVVHGGVGRINRFLFESQMSELDEEHRASGARLVIAGHCGLPFLRRFEHGAWFNPGVIGIPANDGTPRVWYGLIEPVEGSAAAALRVSMHALTYDHEAAARAVEQAGCAHPYGQALLDGLWPSLDVLPAEERAASGRPLEAWSRELTLTSHPAVPA